MSNRSTSVHFPKFVLHRELPTLTNFGKSWALASLLILVPLNRSEVPDRIRRLWCRDFRSAVPGTLGSRPVSGHLSSTRDFCPSQNEYLRPTQRCPLPL